MKINNLNHIEVATQEIVGGGRNRYYYARPVYVNTANAFADAAAFGRNTATVTSTGTFVVSGFSSLSGSSSSSTAIG